MTTPAQTPIPVLPTPIPQLPSSPSISAAADEFRAYGLPIFLFVILGATIALNHKQLMRAGQTRGEAAAVWLLRGSMLTVMLSIFLFFTSAWAMGLISALVCYVVALFAASGSLRTKGGFLVKLQGAWFAILIGIPEVFSKGIIARLSTASCMNFYGEAGLAMCKQGWLAFAEIVAGVILGMTFLSLLVVVSFAVEAAPPPGSSDGQSMDEGLTTATM